MNNLKTKISDLYFRIQALFIKGLLTILPVIVTIWVVHFMYRVLSNWLKVIYVCEPKFLQKIPGSEFLIVIFILILIGIASKYLIINPFINHIEKILHKIPLVSNIYSSAKKLVDFFNIPPDKNVKRQVVLIEYPQKNHFNIAFVLGNASSSVASQLNERSNTSEEFVRVFMPTSPNPTTGFFFMMPRSSVIYTNISFEDAIRTIVSCGLIQIEQMEIINPQNQNSQ